MEIPIRNKGTAAFSLMELLVVSTIIGIIGMAIAVTLTTGLNVWERVQALGGRQTASLVGLEILGRDLQNTFPLFAITLDGTPESVTFPGLVPESDRTSRPVARIGTIKCFLDRNRQALVRKTWVFPSPEPSDAVGEVIVPDVAEITLAYLGAGAGRQGTQWQTSWHSRTNLPLAVQLTVRNRPEKGPTTARRTFFLHNS